MIDANLLQPVACVNLNALESIEIFVDKKNQVCLVNVVEELHQPAAVVLDKVQAAVIGNALLEFAK